MAAASPSESRPVRVLARNPEKVAVLSQAGVEVVEGDLEVPASIDAAMPRHDSAAGRAPSVDVAGDRRVDRHVIEFAAGPGQDVIEGRFREATATRIRPAASAPPRARAGCPVRSAPATSLE